MQLSEPVRSVEQMPEDSRYPRSGEERKVLLERTGRTGGRRASADQVQNQQIHLMKNLAIIGGLLAVFARGSGRYAIERP